MIPIPSPLHPAVVHFPIVLILIGAAVACVAVFVRRWHLPAIVAITLTLGAAGAIVATITGGQEEEMVGELSPAAEKVLDEHEEWGETTRNLAVAAAILSIAAALLGRFPVPAHVVAAIAALVALSAAYGVAQTGHYGGQLVYRHGAGINAVSQAGGAGQEGATGLVEKSAKARHHDDED